MKVPVMILDGVYFSGKLRNLIPGPTPSPPSFRSRIQTNGSIQIPNEDINSEANIAAIAPKVNLRQNEALSLQASTATIPFSRHSFTYDLIAWQAQDESQQAQVSYLQFNIADSGSTALWHSENGAPENR